MGIVSEPPGTVPEHSAADLLAFDPSLVGDSPRVFHRAIASNLHRKMWGQSPARCGDSPRVSPIFLLPNSGQKSVFLHNESLVARLNGLA
jgi:hypothetical protein